MNKKGKLVAGAVWFAILGVLVIVGAKSLEVGPFKPTPTLTPEPTKISTPKPATTIEPPTALNREDWESYLEGLFDESVGADIVLAERFSSGNLWVHVYIGGETKPTFAYALYDFISEEVLATGGDSFYVSFYTNYEGQDIYLALVTCGWTNDQWICDTFTISTTANLVPMPEDKDLWRNDDSLDTREVGK